MAGEKTPRRWIALVALLALLRSVQAAVPVEIVKTDLDPLIRAAAQSSAQFAVHVPHAVSTKSKGNWSLQGDRAIWRYAVRVPAAVSMSFHATPVHLPAGSKLTVRSAVTTTTYGDRELTKSDLWSRIQPGNTLELTLDVPGAQRSKVTFEIVSLQAGYRSLGSGVSDHPLYRRLKLQTAGTDNGSCAQNYMCSATTANTPLALATVGVVVANAWQCSGTLINDVPHDNTPYVLTARHCETGVLGGGEPGQASGVTIYWDAVTPCGQALGSLYDPGTKTQSGATTLVEQQDAWLIQLDDSPVVADAQFAGFDASGGAIQGGYTIHHALGYNKQFTAWYGNARASQQSGVLGTTYQSNFWQVVNQLGNIGPGASGSGLMDQNDHLVGSLSLGATNDSSGYGVCPVNPLTAPNGNNTVAEFTSLAAIWNSTADSTSSTGTVTLKSVLDPANTGTLVVPSMPAAQITFTSSVVSIETGESAQLSWVVPNATQCTASGGLPGDGWPGTLPGTGNQSVTEGSGGVVTYNLSCQLAGGGSVSSSVKIAWDGDVPFVFVYLTKIAVWTTRPAEITWHSNVSPCSISGGGLSLSGLPATGSTTTTQNSPGDVTYSVSCGSGPAAASGSATESFVTPSLLLLSNGTDRTLAAGLVLGWTSAADTCTPSGGAPNDGWATSSFVGGEDYFLPRVSTTGAYTYTLTCSSGPVSMQKSVTVTFENDPPYVTASVSPSSTTFSASPADYITVNWTTNSSGCGPGSTPFLGDWIGPSFPIPSLQGVLAAQGPAIIAPNAPGTYTISVMCSAVGLPVVTSAPMTVTVLPPPPPTAAVSFSQSTVTNGDVDNQVTVSWSSTNASDCTAGGTAASYFYTSWTDGTDIGASGSQIVGPANDGQGQVTFAVTCKSIDPNQGPVTAQAVLNLVPDSATLTPSAASVTQGQSFTLSWDSTGTNQCTASGGGASGSAWSGSLDTSGTVSQTASSVGSFTYTITCGTRLPVQAQAVVTVTASQPANSGGSTTSGGGGGGGGPMTVLEVGLLAILVRRAQARHRRRVDTE